MEKHLFDDVVDQQKSLKDHAVFSSIQTHQDLATFMSWHVFAVWDFMSLVKALQRQLTCMSPVWLPPQNPSTTRLINEIVLAEETDELPSEGHLSHYEMYLEAMREVGCQTHQIEQFIGLLRAGASVDSALSSVSAPDAVRSFVTNTMDLVQHGELVEVLGNFYFGREDVIPQMFTSLLRQWKLDEDDAPMFVYYLKRHIELDGDSHGPAALAMIEEVTQGDDVKIERLKQAARKAIESRKQLWDALHQHIENAREAGYSKAV
jgi:hypothetical protein